MPGFKAQKGVIQCDLEGKEIKKWDSITVASQHLNINIASISGCCNKIKYRKSAGGFTWKFQQIIK